jgi:hypothetical protein
VFSFPFTRLTLNGVHLSQSWIDFGELAVTFYWNPGHCSAPEVGSPPGLFDLSHLLIVAYQLFPDQGPLPVTIPYEIVTATQGRSRVRRSFARRLLTSDNAVTSSQLRWRFDGDTFVVAEVSWSIPPLQLHVNNIALMSDSAVGRSPRSRH